MSSEKSTAIVLRVTEFSETSCVVQMFTRDYGKITAMAKGARRPKSSFEAALDVLSNIRIVFLQKSSGAMDLLTEAKLERRFRNRAADLDWLYAAFYVIELLRTMTEDGDPHPELFDLAVATIDGLDAGPTMPAEKFIELKQWLLRFEVGLLKILGQLPTLNQCAECGRSRTTNEPASLGLQAGGVLCPKCRTGQTNVIHVSGEALLLLNQLADEQRTDVLAINEVRKLMNKYLAQVLGFEPRLYSFLKTLETA